MIAAILFAAACSHAPLFTSADVAQDEYAVYTVSADRRRILRLFKGGGSAVVVQSPFAITAFDLDGPRLYYALDSAPLKQIRVVTTSGGAPAVLVNTAYPVVQIAHDNAAMYWVELPEPSEVWRYDKLRGIAQFTDRATDVVIARADDDAIYYRLGSAEHGVLLWRGRIGFGGLSDVAEVFVDAIAIYYRRGDQLWRSDKSGHAAEVVDSLPHGARFLAVAANRVFTSAGATNICTRETTPLHAATKIAVDSCAVYEIAADALVATPLPPSPRIDASTPAAAKPGDLLRLLGDGFDRLATVTIGNAEAAVVLADERELDVLVPKLPAAGTTVLVRNRDGGCAAAFLNVAQ